MRPLLVSLLACLLLPASASAELHYAAPEGQGTACSQEMPCTLAAALEQAGPGDELRLAKGVYSVGSLNLDRPRLTLSGPEGRYTNVSELPLLQLSGAVRVSAPGVALRRLAVQGQAYSGQALVQADKYGLDIQQVMLTNLGSGSAVQGEQVRLQSSLVRQQSSAGTALQISGSIAASTVIALQGDAIALGEQRCDLKLSGSLVGAARGAALRLDGCPAGKVVLGSSWLPAGGVVRSPAAPEPQRLDSMLPDAPAPWGDVWSFAADGYLLPFDSAGQDAGCRSDCPQDGGRDLLGRPRSVGAGPDLGAIEAVGAPLVDAPAVSPAEGENYRIAFRVDPLGLDAQYRVQLRRYGDETWSTIVDQPLSGDAASNLETQAIGLGPGVLYQARVLASSSAGETASPATTFRTAARPDDALVYLTLRRVQTRAKSLTLQIGVRSKRAGRVSLRAWVVSHGKVWGVCDTSAQVKTQRTLTCRLGRDARRVMRRRPLELHLRATLRYGGGSDTQEQQLTLPAS